jgi:hypothetical protein
MEMARRFVAWLKAMYKLMLDVLMGMVPIAALAGTCKLLRSDNGNRSMLKKSVLVENLSLLGSRLSGA